MSDKAPPVVVNGGWGVLEFVLLFVLAFAHCAGVAKLDRLVEIEDRRASQEMQLLKAVNRLADHLERAR